MRTTIIERIKELLLPLLRKLTGHKHDCCEKMLKRCAKCEVNR